MARRTAKKLRKYTSAHGVIPKMDERISIAETLANQDGTLTESEVTRQLRLQHMLLKDLRKADDLSKTGFRYSKLAGKKGKGLTFGVDMLQFKDAGDRLGGGGGVDVEKWAEVIPDEGAAPASTKGGAGAGGLFG